MITNRITYFISHLLSLQRPLYRHYYQNTDAFIYVIDSNDRERIDDCREELQKMLTEEELKDAPFLILANKQDLPNAMSTQDITEKLQLHQIRDREWCKSIFLCMDIVFLDTVIINLNLAADIQGASAIKGDGLFEGLDWLTSVLTGKATTDAIKKPVAETGKSFLSSIYSSFSQLFNKS